mgnify:FL=1
MDAKEFLVALKVKTGYDFCDYSEQSISRRLLKICEEQNIQFEQLLDKVIADSLYMARFVEDITVNTTELFRDPIVWISLSKTLYQRLRTTGIITFWHIGCSVGLETYSNLILLKERGLIDRVRVFGTDLNPRVLNVARKGLYAYKFNSHFKNNFEEVMSGIGSKSKFEDYFDVDEVKDTMAVKPFLTEIPKYMQQNLVMEKCPFPYKVDVVFVRNVLIYFNDVLQTKIMQMLDSKTYDKAVLILGKQEMIPTKYSGQYEQVGYYHKRM